MHDVLRQRLLRKIESLPEEQVYQVLDYIEFLESKYARDLRAEASGLQRFAERMEDQLRRRAVSPVTLREAFQLISAADRVLSSVSSAGRQIFSDLGEFSEGVGERPAPGKVGDGSGGAEPVGGRSSSAADEGRREPGAAGASGAAEARVDEPDDDPPGGPAAP